LLSPKNKYFKFYKEYKLPKLKGYFLLSIDNMNIYKYYEENLNQNNMITKEERTILGASLSSLQTLLEQKGLGYDCEEQIIKAGDELIVEEEEPLRINHPEYKFCSKGKKGKAVGEKKLNDFIHWFINVEFPTENNENRTVGCVDYHLRKV